MTYLKDPIHWFCADERLNLVKQYLTSDKSDSLGPKLSALQLWDCLGEHVEQPPCIMTRRASCCVPLCTNNFRTLLKHSTSLSAMFVYIRVPPINPINARAPSLGPRLSLFTEVSYMLLKNTRIRVDEALVEWLAQHTRGVDTFSRTRTKKLEGLLVVFFVTSNSLVDKLLASRPSCCTKKRIFIR